MAVDRSPLAGLFLVLDQRLVAIMAPMLAALTAAVRRDAAGDRPIPARRRGLLATLAGELVAGLFGGSPAEAIDADGVPRSPVARLVAAGTRAAARLGLAPLSAPGGAGVPGVAAAAPVLPGAGRAPKVPSSRESADIRANNISTSVQRLSAREWVDPNGLTLSQRVWSNGDQLAAQLRATLEAHIRLGTPAAEAAADLERLVSLRGRLGPGVTTTAQALHATRRLAQHEANRAYGGAAIEGARLSGGLVRWTLSPSHRDSDACDSHARQDNGHGPGIWTPETVPPFPNHVSCRCSLSPVPPAGGGVAIDPELVIGSVTGIGVVGQ